MADALDAIVAHGLMNVLAVMKGAARSLFSYSDRLSSDAEASLEAMISNQIPLFADGVRNLETSLPTALYDRATSLVLAASVATDASVSEREVRRDGLQRLLTLADTVSDDLKRVVWGYDTDSLAALDESMRELASGGPRRSQQ